MSSTTTQHTLPTPAHSVSGAKSHDVTMSQDSPHKRKRAIDDMGDREHKKAHIEPVKLDIEDLHLDVGDKYLLCRTPHPASFPDTTEDLFEKFGLTGLAADLARVKPNGEKNALRKTYKGHIKRLGIMGHFDATRKEIDDPSSFMAMLSIPDHEWHVREVQGRAVQDGLSDSTVATVGRAMTMAKGPVPKSVWDSSVLGELAIGLDGSKVSSARPSAPNTPAMVGTPSFLAKSKAQGLADGASQAQRAPESADALRARKLLNKKRGFGEGVADGSEDGAADERAGFSEADDRGGQKRRKKNSGASQQQQQNGSMRQTGYGPSAVGA
jgi:hypothetical protein